MSENKMAKVAKILGVELDEEFIAKYPKGGKARCRFYKNRFYTSDTGELWNINSNAFLDLLSGECTIHKLPWKAKSNEIYFAPLLRGIEKYGKFKVTTNLEDMVYQRGLMCKTPEQAKELAQLLIKTARQFQGFEDEEEQNNE